MTDEKIKTYWPAMMQGRLSSELQADHGSVVHAVHESKAKRHPCPANDWGRKSGPDDYVLAHVSLCGKRPGRKSVGWSTSDKEAPVTCPRCLKKIEKMQG